MIKQVIFSLEIVKDYLDIRVNGISKKKITIKNKTINTKDIFKMLDYEKTKIYELGCKRIEETEMMGESSEIKRLYNYVYDLFDDIINTVNITNKEMEKNTK